MAEFGAIPFFAWVLGKLKDKGFDEAYTRLKSAVKQEAIARALKRAVRQDEQLSKLTPELKFRRERFSDDVRDRILALVLQRDLDGLGHYIVHDAQLLEDLGLPAGGHELELIRNRLACAVFTTVLEVIVNDSLIHARFSIETGLTINAKLNDIQRIVASMYESRPRPAELAASSYAELFATRFEETDVLFIDLVKVAYDAMPECGILERNALALSVARAARGSSELEAGVLDEFAGIVSERLASNAWGGRSYTHGAFLSLLHPQAGNQISLDSATQLMTTVAQMLNRDSALNPELPLLLGGFIASRFRDRDPNLMHVVEDFARQACRQSSIPVYRRVGAVLLHWVSQPSEGLERIYTMRDLDDLIVRPLRTDSLVFASADLAEMSARQIAIKPVAERSLDERILYDDCIRHLAATSSDVWTLAGAG